jgi:hypothetical protein
MAKWIISEYDVMPLDKVGNALPIARKALASRKFAAATDNIALNANTRYVRFCGDTAAHVKAGAGAADTDEYVPAGQDFWLAPDAAALMSFIVG